MAAAIDEHDLVAGMEERWDRKAWRTPQSKAGVVNKDYLAQKALLAKLDKGELQLADVQAKTRELFDAELAKLN